MMKRHDSRVSIRDEVRMHKYWANAHIVALLGFQDIKYRDTVTGVQMLMEYVSLLLKSLCDLLNAPLLGAGWLIASASGQRLERWHPK